MSDGIFWLAGGLLAGSAFGLFGGKKIYGPSRRLREARGVARKHMDTIEDFLRRIKSREKEVRAGTLLHTPAHQLSPAEREFWRKGIEEQASVAQRLRAAGASLTAPQVNRLRKLTTRLRDLAQIAPTILKQANIDAPKLEEKDLPALLPEDPYMGGTPGQPQKQGQPKGPQPAAVDKFKSIIAEQYKKLGSWTKVRDVMKQSHAGLLNEVRATPFWAGYVKKFPAWA